MVLSLQTQNKGGWLFRNRNVLALCVLPIGLGVHLLLVTDADVPVKPIGLETVWYELFCLALCFLGLLVRARSEEFDVPAVFQKSGWFEMLRRPVYLGNFAMWLGVSMLTEKMAVVVGFAIFFRVAYKRVIAAESKI